MPTLKYLLARRLVIRMAQETAQETEQEKVKTFHIEQFLKTHKRTKKGSHAWKSSSLCTDKQQE